MTLTEVDQTLKDFYPRAGERIKQYVVDMYREDAWVRQTCPFICTEVHDDNTGSECRNSGGAQWDDLVKHDCCGECNEFSEWLRANDPRVRTWLAEKAKRPPIEADKTKVSDEIAEDIAARQSPLFAMLKKPTQDR